MKHELHYAPITLEGDIPCIYFDSYATFCKGLEFIIRENKNKNIVYLLSYLDEVFVSDNAELITDIFNHSALIHFKFLGSLQKIFLQEYASYQEAYEVALTMMEGNPLCYDKEATDEN